MRWSTHVHRISRIINFHNSFVRRVAVTFRQSCRTLVWAAACGIITAASCAPLVTGLAFDLVLGDRFGADPGDPVYAPKSFVNWETPHVSPLDITPDGSKLLAVNTPDNRLEVFDITGGSPVWTASIFVGLDPVTVRVRDDNEAWVVNHVSDSISIVNLLKENVVRTLRPGDEPTDVVFAGGRAFVVCSQLNQVMAYGLADLAASPISIPIEGEDPRAIAVSPDGGNVYAAIFESGSDTSIVPPEIVSDPNGPYEGLNPPPKFGDEGFAELIEQMPIRPRSSIIARKNEQGDRWLDDNGRDWASLISWDLHTHDVAVIDSESLNVSYVNSLMNLNMQLSARSDGLFTVVGTEATNEIRFEPAVTGRFVRSVLAIVDPNDPAGKSIVDLNPHLADEYAAGISTIPQEERAASIADPRGVVWTSDGTTGYVSGMGSNNVAVIDSAGSRLATIEVGAGPTGLALDESRNRLYVLNKFDTTISTIDTSTNTENERAGMFDPTPEAILLGRPFLYNARLTSGLGVTACGSCHVDARMDQISWDLGDPTGEVQEFDQTCEDLRPDISPVLCEDFHPIKGPMATQTLQGIIGQEPLHWRGDRNDLSDFNPAFVGLNGAERQLTSEEMSRFEAFLATIQFPPNPNRNLDNSLKGSLDGADPRRGREIFLNDAIDGDDFALFSCNRCHQLPNGTNRTIIPRSQLGEPQGAKVPQLRNMYEKTGFTKDSQANNRGFGFLHDGSLATINEFLHFDRFLFGDGPVNEQRRQDVIAFVMSLSVDTHAAIGLQVTLDGINNSDPEVVSLLDLMAALADEGDVGLVVKGRQGGQTRGYMYIGGGLYQSDRAGQQIGELLLRLSAGVGAELTWTVVPLGSETRIGVDRDLDGVLDGDV
jgi:YVTN family beta-propeller protein